MAAPEALDITKEPDYILDIYGIQRSPKTWPKKSMPRRRWTFRRKCLAARRLIERGVRFVQIWSGNDNGFPRRNWDSHEDVRRDHAPLARRFRPRRRGLNPGPEQRGLLEDTVILWTRSSGACLPRRRKGAITSPIVLPIGSAGEESKAE